MGGGGAIRTTTWANAALVPRVAIASAASKNFFIRLSFLSGEHGLHFS
jgi:hypothetical protein